MSSLPQAKTSSHLVAAFAAALILLACTDTADAGSGAAHVTGNAGNKIATPKGPPGLVRPSPAAPGGVRKPMPLPAKPGQPPELCIGNLFGGGVTCSPL